MKGMEIGCLSPSGSSDLGERILSKRLAMMEEVENSKTSKCQCLCGLIRIPGGQVTIGLLVSTFFIIVKGHQRR